MFYSYRWIGQISLPVHSLREIDMSTRPDPRIPKGLLPKAHFTVNKSTNFDPKAGHQRQIERWLLQLLQFIGLKCDVGIGLIYRKKVSGMLGGTRLAVIGPEKSNPCAIGFRVQPGDNGTCVEVLMIFPRNMDDFFPPYRGGEGMHEIVGLNAIVNLCKEAFMSDEFVLDAPTQDDVDESPEEEPDTDVPSTSSLLAGLQKRLTACVDRSAELQCKIERVKDEFDRTGRLVINSRSLVNQMANRMRSDFETLVNKHLVSLEEEKQVALLEITEDVKKFEEIRAEIARLDRAIAALRS